MNEWTAEQMMEVINNQATAAVYLYTPLCGTCQVAGKMLGITEHLVPNLSMGKADLNYIPEMAERFSIESVPCLLIFHQGKLVEKVYAFHSVPYLLEKLRYYM